MRNIYGPIFTLRPYALVEKTGRTQKEEKLSEKKHFMIKEAYEMGNKLNIDWNRFDVGQFRMGYKILGGTNHLEDIENLVTIRESHDQLEALLAHLRKKWASIPYRKLDTHDQDEEDFNSEVMESQ